MSAGMTLENGKAYYLVGNSLELQAPETRSALVVPSGVTAYLFVNAGQSLVCRGGDAYLDQGAGAGIEIQEGGKLYIIGGGTVIAYGGRGGLGTEGTDGTDGRVEKDSRLYIGGDGGRGGNGGGGAGAGIGGRGGNGSMGAPEQRSKGWTLCSPVGPFYYDGITGENAPDAEKGSNMGQLCVMGTTMLSVYPGGCNADEITEITKSGSTKEEKINKKLNKNTYVAGGGGGGGHGANGNGAPYGIGGGAGGSGGGGAGSSGATFNYWINFDLNFFVHFLINQGIKAVAYLAPTPGMKKAFNKVVDIVKYVTDFDNINFTGTDYTLDGSHGQGALNPSGNRYPLNYVDHTGVKKYTTITGRYEVMTPSGSVAGFNGANGDRGQIQTLYYPSIFSHLQSGEAEDQSVIAEKLSKMPDDLHAMLSTTLTFDTLNVGKGGKVVNGTNRVDMCVGDELPVLTAAQLPVHKEDIDKDGNVSVAPKYAFGGYCDQNGNRWYDEKGKAVLDGGKFLSVDSVRLSPVWENNVYCLVVHCMEPLASGTVTTDKYVPYHIDFISKSIYKEDGSVNDEVVFDIQAYQGDDSKATNYSEYVTGFHAQKDRFNFNVKKEDFHQITAKDLDIEEEWAKDYKSLANAVVCYVYYDRNAFDVVWDIPDGTVIADTEQEGKLYYHPYTKNVSSVKYGSRIIAPKYVNNYGADGHGARTINGWKRFDGDKVVEDVDEAKMWTMPNHKVYYRPEFKPVMIDVSVESQYGVVKFGPDGDASGTVADVKRLQCNTDIDFTVTPQSGWDVDNYKGIKAYYYYRSADGTWGTDSTTLYMLSGQENRFSLPVRGESMRVVVDYQPQHEQLTVVQPMNFGAITSKTYIQPALSGNVLDQQMTQKATYDVRCGNYVRMFMAPVDVFDRIDYGSIKVCKGNDASGEPIDYTVSIETIDGKKTELAVAYIEFQIPDGDVYVTYGLNKSKNNVVTLTVPEGVKINYGYADEDCALDQDVNHGNISYTDNEVPNDAMLFIEYTDSLTPKAYVMGANGKEALEGALYTVTRRIEGKDVKGFLFHVPADASEKQFFVEAGQNDIVAFEVEPTKESGVENEESENVSVFRRNNNDIAIQIFDDAIDFEVPEGYEAVPMGGEEYLHVSIEKEYKDTELHPICIPASFSVTEDILNQCEIFCFTKMVKVWGTIMYSTKSAPLKVGDTFKANSPYMIRMKKPGTLKLNFETKKWENTVPVPMTLASTDVEGEDLTFYPVYKETHPVELYKDDATNPYFWKLQSNKFKHIMKPTVKISPLEFYGYQHILRVNDEADDLDGDGLADNIVMDIIDDNEVDGIVVVNRDKEDQPAIYDLFGRKVTETTKGIYIINNRKVIVK